MSAEEAWTTSRNVRNASAAGSAPGYGVASTTTTTNAATNAAATGVPELEALSCVSCRARKLKCCRTKPACTRCVKVKTECVYPESRRKPTFKRRNVKELEERLAQVEVLLKDAATKTPSGCETSVMQDGDVVQDYQSESPAAATAREPPLFPDTAYLASGGGDAFTSPMSWNFDNTKVPASQNIPFSVPDSGYRPSAESAAGTSWELLGMGMFETLPPTGMIEELHEAYFTRQHMLIPIIHPARYIQAFYSAPHLRPPMALQYAVWMMASLGHEKYSPYHDVFHRRSRRYLEEDELKDDGEHFVTVAHAQAWALIATAEARNMWFTRAAMSTSRCVKLLHMMGLHRLDDPNAEYEMAPTIAPPKDWTELEERRRVFWGAFAIDSHASISTGWPCLIDPNDVTTHLPSSEESFNQCREETACRLDEVFTGSQYSSFASAMVICHLFNRIMKHVHHGKQDDNPQDYDYGKYWNRHRELDNLVSSAFMYLPEAFRLPKYLKNPVAVHTNLNLHASTICLHNRAYEMAIEHNLPENVKMMSKTRLETTAQEIVSIVKLTSHSNAGYRSPLVALALYVASSVYIAVVAVEQELKPTDIANLEFLLLAMEAISVQHAITRSFLGQAIEDVHRAGLAGRVCLPKTGPRPDIPDDGTVPPPCGSNNIPIFARSRISKHSRIMPPLPGKLPLNNPMGGDTRGQQRNAIRKEVWQPLNTFSKELLVPGAWKEDQGNTANNKRRRVESSPDPSGGASSSLLQDPSSMGWAQSRRVEEISSSGNTPPTAAGGMSAGSRPNSIGGADQLMPLQYQYGLPHRTGSSTTGSSPSAALNSSSTPSSSGVGTGLSMGQATVCATMGSENLTTKDTTTEIYNGIDNQPNISANSNMFQGFQGFQGWGHEGSGLSAGYSQQTPDGQQQQQRQQQNGEYVTALDDESWMVLNDAAVLHGGHSWDAGMGSGVA